MGWAQKEGGEKVKEGLAKVVATWPFIVWNQINQTGGKSPGFVRLTVRNEVKNAQKDLGRKEEPRPPNE